MYRDEELPKTIAGGQYRLTKRVGQGGMAAVYLAEVDLDCFDFALVVAGHESAKGETDEERHASRQQRYEQWVKKPRAELIKICDEFNLPYPRDGVAAVKVMIPQEREDAVQRFESEWRQLLAINHPHLIKVFGGGYEDNVPWYSMEYVTNILPVKKIRKLPELAKLDVIFQAAGGLEKLHEQKIVHRDIKPANLLCCMEDERVRVRVMDLGIAKMAASKEGLTLSHHVMGTPYYMSPEQAGSSKRVDHRADIYSLGAALYSLVTGRRPYDGKSMYEIVGHLVRGEGPEKPLHVNPDMNSDVGHLIERMMELDLERRPQSMTVVRDAIKAIFEGDSAKARKLLGVKKVVSRNKARTRTRAGSSTGSQKPGSRLSAVRQRSPRQQQGSPSKGGLSMGMLAGGIGLCVLLVAAIVYVVSGGDEPSGPADPFDGPVVEKPAKPDDPKRPRDTQRPDPVTRQPGDEKTPDGGKALAELDRLGKATLARIQAGDLSTLDETLNTMWGVADGTPSAGPRYQEWKKKLEAARGVYCDGLARRGLAAARAGQRDEARRLMKRLAGADATHEKLPELRELVDPKPKSTAGKGTLQATVDGRAVQLPIQFDKLDLNPGDNGPAISFKSLDSKNGQLIVTVQVGRGGNYLVECQLSQVGGRPHLHHWVVSPQKRHVCMKVPAGWAAQPRNYRLRVASFQPGVNKLAFNFPDTLATYRLGPLRITRLFSDPAPLDRKALADLRKKRLYIRAQQLLERYAEVMKKPKLRKLATRMSQLSQFEGAVLQVQAQQGRRTQPLADLPPNQAIEYYRFANKKDDGKRAATEALFLWEIGDKRALEWAQTALRKGALVSDLIEEIKKGVRQ